MMLEVRHLVRIYKVKNADPVYALNDVSLKFPETGLVFILGKSGSGKSTLLNVMGGLDKADEGEIIINGKSSKDFTGSEMDSYRNTYLGFIFQEYNILQDFTVGENVALALKLQHKKADEEEVDKILEEVDLKGFTKRKPNSLSGGQKQRVAIARALVKDPKIIFADEPTGALDSNTGKQVFETLKKLSANRLVVVVSHDRDFAEHFGDRVIELKDGRVISDITKTHVPPKEETEGIALMGDGIIRIEKGHLLTEKDLPFLNEALKKNDTEAFLTSDPHVNDAVLESARIDKSGNRENFVKTDPDKIKEGKGEFETITSHFSLGNAFKMGLKSMKVKPFRLAMTILLCMTSFTMFGLGATLATFNTKQQTKQVIAKENIVATRVGKRAKNSGRYEEGFSDEMISTIKQESGLEVLPIYTASGSLPLNTSENPYPYYKKTLSDGTYISPEIQKEFGLELCAGRLPENDQEVLITEYLYQSFKDFGYNKDGVILSSNEVTYDSLLGKNIQLQLSTPFSMNTIQDYQIVGILDTHFPADKYKVFKTQDAHTDNFMLMNSLDELKNTYHGFVYFTKTAFEKGKEENLNQELIKYLTLNFEYGDPKDGKYGGTAVGYFKDHTDVYYFNKDKTEQTKGDVLVSPEDYLQLYQGIHASEDKEIKKTIDGVYKSETEDEPYVYSGLESKIYSYIPEMAKYKVVHDDYTYFFENDKEKFDEVNQSIYQFGVDEKGNYNDSVLTDKNKYQVFTYYFETSLLPKIQSDSSLSGNDEKYQQDYAKALSSIETSISSDCDPLLALSYDVENEKEAYTESFIQKNASGYSEGGTTLEDKEKSLRNLLMDSQSEYISSEYVKTYYKGWNQKLREEIKQKKTPEPITLTSVRDVRGSVFLNSLTVVGLDSSLYPYMFPDQYTSSCFSFSLEDFNDVKKQTGDWQKTIGPSSLLLLICGNENKFVDYYLKEYEKFSRSYSDIPDGTWAVYLEDNEISSVIGLSSSISSMRKGFIIAGIVLALFAMLLFYNFISISINNKKREIGILRAVGAKGGDVFKIFYSESFVIAMINFLFATILTFVFSSVINSNMTSALSVSVTLFNPNIWVVLLILLVALLTAFLASLLPVYKIASKKPIDAIQGR